MISQQVGQQSLEAVPGCEKRGLLHTWKAAGTWIASTLELSRQEPTWAPLAPALALSGASMLVPEEGKTHT